MIIKGYDQYINGYDKYMKGYDKQLNDYDKYIKGYYKYISGYDNYIYLTPMTNILRTSWKKIFTAMTNIFTAMPKKYLRLLCPLYQWPVELARQNGGGGGRLRGSFLHARFLCFFVKLSEICRVIKISMFKNILSTGQMITPTSLDPLFYNANNRAQAKT